MIRPASDDPYRLRRMGRGLLHLGLVLLLLAAVSLSTVRLMELAYRYTPVESVRDGILEQLREWASDAGKPFHPQQARNVISTYSDALADYASARKELVRPDLSRALALYLALPEGVTLDRIAIDQGGEAFYLYCSLSQREDGQDSGSGESSGGADGGSLADSGAEDFSGAGTPGRADSSGQLPSTDRQEEVDRLAQAFTTALLSQRVFQQVERAAAPQSSDFVLVVSWEEPRSGTASV